MSQLKAGDLALIVGCFENSSNVGKCVELVSSEIGPARVEFNRMMNWVKLPAGVKAWVVAGESLVGVVTKTGEIKSTHEYVLPESHLIPLRGLTLYISAEDAPGHLPVPYCVQFALECLAKEVSA